MGIGAPPTLPSARIGPALEVVMSCSCHPDPEPRTAGVSRRLVLAGGLAAGVAPFLPRVAGAQTPPATFETAGTPPTTGTTGTTTTTAPPPPVSQDYGFLPPRPADEVHVRPMMFPVLPDATLGKASWSDTYLAPRSGGHRHEGQDLMGKKMLKLLAVVSGTIVELRHQSSGNSLYLKGDDGWYYCYLHINNDDPGTDNGANQFKYAFAPGMAIGKRVLKGDHIAFLGDSGNAEATGAHCHFEIRMPNDKWYNAAAVNAAYSLRAAASGMGRSLRAAERRIKGWTGLPMRELRGLGRADRDEHPAGAAARLRAAPQRHVPRRAVDPIDGRGLRPAARRSAMMARADSGTVR